MNEALTNQSLTNRSLMRWLRISPLYICKSLSQFWTCTNSSDRYVQTTRSHWRWLGGGKRGGCIDNNLTSATFLFLGALSFFFRWYTLPDQQLKAAAYPSPRVNCPLLSPAGTPCENWDGPKPPAAGVAWELELRLVPSTTSFNVELLAQKIFGCPQLIYRVSIRWVSNGRLSCLNG